jgi:Na+/phosphate symporter
MKKALLFLSLLAVSLSTYAQDKPEPLVDRGLLFDILNTISVVTVIYLIASFITRIVKYNFDYRLKSKIVDRQTGEGIVSQLVQPEQRNMRQTILQWFCTLLGIGIGFTIMYLTTPLGLHSLAIMAFSVAAGLGAYYFLGKEKKP